MNMRIERLDILLGSALAVTYIVMLTPQVRISSDWQDWVWLTISVIGVAIYATAGAKANGGVRLLIGLTKIEIIILFAQCIGFLTYCIRSHAIQHRDIAAWLYFYPLLLISAITVAVTYPLSAWFVSYIRR